MWLFRKIFYFAFQIHYISQFCLKARKLKNLRNLSYFWADHKKYKLKMFTTQILDTMTPFLVLNPTKAWNLWRWKYHFHQHCTTGKHCAFLHTYSTWHDIWYLYLVWAIVKLLNVIVSLFLRILKQWSLRDPKCFSDNLNLEERCRLLSLELLFVLLINSRMSLGSSITWV